LQRQQPQTKLLLYQRLFERAFVHVTAGIPLASRLEISTPFATIVFPAPFSVVNTSPIDNKKWKNN
jgi:hypothetical protein